MGRLRHWWAQLRSSLWVVPGGVTLFACALALGFIELDVAFGLPEASASGLVSRADGARSILSTIASSIVTVAGVAFSITIVALVLTASQYSSRVLRNFMRDLTSQLVLGLLVGTFAYCLLLLREIHTDGSRPFVPNLSLLAAVILAILSIAAFVYFIHHIAIAIQASSIAASVAAETVASVETLFPEELGDEAHEADDARRSAAVALDLTRLGGWIPVRAEDTGYLQHVDEDGLLAFACEREAVIRMEAGIGEFMIEGGALASVSGPPDLDAEAAARLRRLFTLRRQRSIEQDAGFGIRQLVDVALKALSPGVNDTTTAVICVDWLSAIIVRLAGRRLPRADRYDAGALRVIARVPTFGGLLDEAFSDIRQNAAGNGAVLQRQLTGVAEVLRRVHSRSRAEALRHHARLILAVARRSLPIEADRRGVEAAATEIGL